MIKKIIILTLALIFISSIFSLAAEIDSEDIQKLISQGKTQEALSKLKNTEQNLNSDLKFYKALLLSWQEEYKQAENILKELIEANPQRLDSYNQLARIYGWQRDFIKAEEIIEKAQNINYSSQRTAILSQHAEWQASYFKARDLIEEAIVEAETSQLKDEYKKKLKRIEDQLRTILYLEGRAVYSEDDKEDLELAVGLEKLLWDGLNFETAVGTNYFKNESNLLLRSKLEISQPLIPEKTAISSDLIFYNGNSKDKYEINNSFDYLINTKNLFGINYNLVENNTNPDYQSLELEYEHRFKKIILVLKNTSRHDDSGWESDFSQHLDLYYPSDNYLLNLSLSHYSGEEYVFKIGFEFSDIFSGEKVKLSSLNLWFNNQETSNLDFRMDLK